MTRFPVPAWMNKLVEGVRLFGGRAVSLRLGARDGAVACDGYAALWLADVRARAVARSERELLEQVADMLRGSARWLRTVSHGELYAFATAAGPLSAGGSLRGAIAPGVMIDRRLLRSWLPPKSEGYGKYMVSFDEPMDQVRIDGAAWSLVIMPVRVGKPERYWEAFGEVPHLLPDGGCVPFGWRAANSGALALPNRIGAP